MHRLQDIEDEINKNINEICRKWNMRKVVLDEPFDENQKESCPACMASGKQNYLQYLYVNINEAVYKCQRTTCRYPYRNFKYINYTDRTTFRYEPIPHTSQTLLDKKVISSSPAKVDNSIDCSYWDLENPEFNLDSILSSQPQDVMASDMTEIIDNICNAFDAASNSTSSSPTQERNPPAAKLSKCLKLMRNISPTSSKVRETEKLRAPKVTVKKKQRTPSQSHKEISPTPSIVIEQQEVNYEEWMDVVNRIELENINEVQFTLPIQTSEMEDNQVSVSHEPLEGSTSMFLVSLVDSNDGQLTNDSKPFVLKNLDLNEVVCESTSKLHLKEQMAQGSQTSAGPKLVTGEILNQNAHSENRSTDDSIAEECKHDPQKKKVDKKMSRRVPKRQINIL
ncbi:hypothetical protein Bhyg_00830, partial [Pseudolycoriella hygida]